MAAIRPNGLDRARNGLEARRGKGHLCPSSCVDHSFGYEKGESVRVRHDSIVILRRLLDDLAPDALVETANARRRLWVSRRGAQDDSKRPLSERKAHGTEKRMRCAPRYLATQDLGQRQGRADLDASHVENHLSGAEPRTKL